MLEQWCTNIYENYLDMWLYNFRKLQSMLRFSFRDYCILMFDHTCMYIYLNILGLIYLKVNLIHVYALLIFLNKFDSCVLCIHFMFKWQKCISHVQTHFTCICMTYIYGMCVYTCIIFCLGKFYFLKYHMHVT